MAFVVDNTDYVSIYSTSFRVYYSGKASNQLTINSGGLMDAGEFRAGNLATGNDLYDQIYTGPIPGAATPVTTFTIGDATNPSMQTWPANRGDTTHTFNFNFSAGTLIDPSTSTYVLTVTAVIDPGLAKNIHNGFWAFSSNANGFPSYIGFDSKLSNTSFGIQQRIDPRGYAEWRLKFGADCTTLPVGRIVPFKWYDADNNNATIQPRQMSFQIIDDTIRTSPQVVQLIDGTQGGNDNSTFDFITDTVIPGNGSKLNGSIGFFAIPAHTYYVKFDQVYTNNTLQFQLPFDSIYHEINNCASDYNLKPSMTGPAAGAILSPGQNYLYSEIVKNVGTDTSPAFTMDASETTGTGRLTLTGGYTKLWPDQPPLGAGLTQTHNFYMTVAPNTPDGTTVCMRSTVSPSTPILATLTSPAPGVCNVVRRTYYPSLVGRGSDIHAGGGVCGQAAPFSSGTVSGSGSGISIGEYVVSANNGISNGFGSNNQPANGSAKLGGAGGYNSVCRYDLSVSADKYIAAGGAKINVGGGAINLSSAPFNDPSQPDVVYVTGGNVFVHGVVSRKLTIYNPNAASQVIFDNNVQINSSVTTTAANVPSLGIITKGNVQFRPAVTVVDAYVFATGGSGNIDTCAVSGGLPGVYASCRNTLNMHGFLMAPRISLNRLGPLTPTGTATVGEDITLTPQLYLNPPRFFDNAGIQNLTQSQGERPPLY